MSEIPTPGAIITFYSYKGGTGRSMALANAGCLLAASASKERGVLMIDWDLEAPGLHRYFHRHIEVPSHRKKDVEQFIDEKSGLLDLFLKLETQIPKDGFGESPNDQVAAFTLLGYMLAEFRGRREARFRDGARYIAVWAAGAGAVAELLEGFRPDGGASVLRLVLLIVAALYGSWLYHLQRAHVRRLLGRA